MQTRTSLSGGNLGSEGNVVAQFVCQVADNPLGYHQLVGCILGAYGQKLYLVLFVDHAVNGEVAHLRVAVLYLTASLCNVCHALGSELVELGIRCRLMITFLVGGREHLRVRGYYVILQLAHSLELHTCYLVEGTACLAQGVLGRTLQGFTVLVEV